MQHSKKVCMAFLGNALHDSRITNLTNSLRYDGYRVSVIGFDWFITSQNYSDENIHIFNLKKSGIRVLFYLKFTFILCRELFKTNANLFIAEDFYTLPFVTVIAYLDPT